MRKCFAVLAALFLFILLSGCTAKPLSLLAVPSEFQMTPTEDGLEEFLALQPEIPPSYPGDSFANVTPDFVKEHSEFRVFKCEQSSYSLLQYRNNLYGLAPWFGGLGLTCLALADLNEDGIYELYFTASSGSGIHRSEIGYFDPVQEKTTLFEETYVYGDLMLSDSNGSLAVCTAALNVNARSFAELQAVKGQEIARLEYLDGTIQVNRGGYEGPENHWDIVSAGGN